MMGGVTKGVTNGIDEDEDEDVDTIILVVRLIVELLVPVFQSGHKPHWKMRQSVWFGLVCAVSCA